MPIRQCPVRSCIYECGVQGKVQGGFVKLGSISINIARNARTLDDITYGETEVLELSCGTPHLEIWKSRKGHKRD